MDKDTTTFIICFVLLCWPFFIGIYAKIYHAVSNAYKKSKNKEYNKEEFIDSPISVTVQPINTTDEDEINKLRGTFNKVLLLLADTPPEDYLYVLPNLPESLNKNERDLIDKITRNVEKSIDNSYELVPNLSFAFAEFVVEVTDLSNNHQYTSPAKCLVTHNKDKTYYFILEFHYPNSGFERFYLPLNRLPGENKTSVNFKYPRLCITEEGKQFKIKLLKKNIERILIDKTKYNNFRKDNT